MTVAGIVSGILAIAIVIAIGWVARRQRLLPEATASVLVDLMYWVASPALLFSTLSTADVHAVLGGPLAVAAGAGVATAVIFAPFACLFLRQRGAGLVLSTMAGSLNNGALIGIPIAAYVLSNVSHAVPVMVFQLGFFTPMYFVLVDLAAQHRRPQIGQVSATVAKNPMVIAALLGFVCSWFSVPVPAVIALSADLIGQAAPPLVLIAFGASMVDKQKVTPSAKAGDASSIAVTTVAVTIAKLVLQPTLACALGWGLGLRGEDLMAVTVMACLPSAQNVFVAAVRAETGVEIARAAVAVTTMVCLPVLIALAWLFHSFVL